MKEKSDIAAKCIARSLEEAANDIRSNSGIWTVHLKEIFLTDPSIQRTTMGLQTTVDLVGNYIDRSRYKYRKGKKGESPQYYQIAEIGLADLSKEEWL